MEKLKRCPFCGGLAFLERTQEQYYVKCYHKDVCYFYGRQKYNIREAAVKKWNRRVTDDTTERS